MEQAYSHGGDDDFMPPSERSLHFRQITSFARPRVMSVLFVQFFTIVAKTWMRHSHLTTSSTWSILIKTITAFIALACGHIFVNGINQIYDAEMDKVSKPFLPIPSGELSMNNAWLLTLSFAIVSLLLAGSLNSGPFLFGIGFLLFMGYAYNLPPLSMKFSTYGAILAIGLTSGFLNVVCAHLIAKAALGLPLQVSPFDAFTTISTTIIALTGGFMKDLADYEGDTKIHTIVGYTMRNPYGLFMGILTYIHKFNVPILASKLGLRKTTYLGVGIVLMNYIGGILAALSMPQALKTSIVIPAHLLFSIALIYEVWKLEKGNYSKEARFNLHISLLKHHVLEFLVFILM